MVLRADLRASRLSIVTALGFAVLRADLAVLRADLAIVIVV